ncbi:hypothetical protein JTE90_028380 [Oedothorax gibbosus]|uniref:Neurotransmitter-gated ion-channel ligand-binding domain-containing protein n=1 Tax=Oedothorax gibbosus TaxID=931172 RepID=A0AAV6VBJ9_9ARAC|nr:hypothetical protein JTE90_028380 [Oedothorax gibbosus]
MFCSQSKTIEKLCNSILPDDYEIYKAPSKNGNAIEVRVALQVMDIDEINEYSMDFRLHSFITAIWNDTRLKLDEYKGGGNSNSLYEKCRHYIWTPDLFFENAKKVDLFENTSPSTILKKRSDGAIVMTKRYSFKAGCEMNFENYPFDHQKCRFLLALMYSSDNIARLKWMGETSYKSEISSIIISRTVQPLQFSLQASYTYELTETWLEGEEYTA